MADTRRALSVAVATSFRADRRRCIAVLALLVVASSAGVLTAFWFRRIFDSAAAHDEGAAMAAVVGIGLTLAAAGLARSTITHIQFTLKEHTALYVDRSIIDLVGGIPTVEHHERPAYLDQLEVLRNEAWVLSYAWTHAATALAVVLQACLTGILLASINPWLLVVPVFAIASFWGGTKAEQLRQQALNATADTSRRARHLFELATSPAAGKELRVFGLGAELVRRHEAAWGDADGVLDSAALQGLAWTAAGWLVFSAGYAGAIVLVASQAVAGHATLGDVVLTLALVAAINRHVGMAVMTVRALARVVKVADRYLWLIDYADAATVAGDDPAPAPDRLKYGIDLRDVSFRYPGTEVDVLAGIDLTLPAGTTVAVVGDNGSGKSTLVKLLCRFYEPSSGVITVDGTDLRRIDVAQWRSRMSAGFQDFARLELRAAHTIGVGDLAHLDDSEAVGSALRRAASADVVTSLPEGLETQLGASFDAGAELSGGQWQKLALARAMMRPAPLLLVLDEPTAALDAETEHDLFERYASAASAVAARTGGITVVVSHRFSTVRMADLIVVVSGGRIVEVGSHDELEEAGGLYAELYELQARSYR